MVSEITPELTSPEGTQRRGRGPAKSFPLTPFQDALVLPRALHDHGVDGVLRRVTAFDRMGRSPESGAGRQLVTDAARYGLTSGSYQAEQLRLDEDGKRLFQPGISERKRKEMEFEFAIRRFEPFGSLYERLKDKRVPAPDVLIDQLTAVPAGDRQKCAEVFLKNLRYIGLIREVAGAERVISIEQMLEEVPEKVGTSAAREPERAPAARVPDVEIPSPEARERSRPAAASPTLHIDVNIHIGSDASPEQIEQIFASMARHLYGRTEES